MAYHDLADRLKTDSGFLERLVSNISGHYRSFAIPKRRGGVRIIAAPSPALLSVQRKILQHVLLELPVHPAAKAYVPGKGLRENARFHMGQDTLIKLDIRNFFGSITDCQVAPLFLACVSNRGDAEVLTKLCTHIGKLPQGAATSGYLSNLVFAKCDKAIMRKCRRAQLRYTRYADDIVISGQVEQPAQIIKMVSREVQKIGLSLNRQKTFVARNSKDRQTVTGIVVNERLSPGRGFLRAIRQEIHFAEKWGLAEHSAREGYAAPEDCLRRLHGRVAFASQILKDQTVTNDWKEALARISTRHKTH